MNYKQKIQILREKINQISLEILTNINLRAQLALEIGKIKKAVNAPIYEPRREKEFINFISENNKGGLPNKDIRKIFKLIIKACRDLQIYSKISEEHKIGFLGPLGSFSHQAALKYWGDHLNIISFKELDEIFSSIEKHEIDYAIVPLENSIAGFVPNTLHWLIKENFTIIDEITMQIELFLLTHSRSQTNKIHTIYSHKMAIKQCQEWIKANFKNVKVVETDSTSRAALEVQKDKNAAAIASYAAAKLYDLNILDKVKIDNSYTTFIILQKHDLVFVTNQINNIQLQISEREIKLFKVYFKCSKLSDIKNFLKLIKQLGISVCKVKTKKIKYNQECFYFAATEFFIKNYDTWIKKQNDFIQNLNTLNQNKQILGIFAYD